jgi:hypothetical protein
MKKKTSYSCETFVSTYQTIICRMKGLCIDTYTDISTPVAIPHIDPDDGDTMSMKYWFAAEH